MIKLDGFLGATVWNKILFTVLITGILAAQTQQKNPFNSDADVQKGAGLFGVFCATCHGANGEGGRGTDLTAGVYRMGGSDAELFHTIRFGVPGTEMPPIRVSEDDAWRLTAFVTKIGSRGMAEKAPGDAASGKGVYGKAGCAACHRIAGEGTELGPDLTEIGRRRGLAFLEQSIVNPDAYVANEYRAVSVALKSGRGVAGVRLNEDDLSIQLRDAGGNLRSYMKDDIREIRRDKPSLMPSYKNLSKAELADLVAYLNSLKGAH